MTPKKRREPAAFRLDDPSLEIEAGERPVQESNAPVSEMATPEALPAESSLGNGRSGLARGWRLGRLFLAAAGALLTLAVGYWVSELIEALFDRAAWLGWTGLAVAALAGLSFVALVVREVMGLIRLARVTRLRAEADAAAAGDDRDAARLIARELVRLYAARPDSARGRANVSAHAGEIIDGRDLLRLAERELMTPLDRKARALVTGAAQRVSVVTAVSPRALVDVLYVAFESLRLVRQIGALYGGRPSGLALIRLARLAIGHLAITGSLAMTDSLVHQVVGQGLAARVSARLGEGVVNGLMTARVGLAALDVCRPLPWLANDPPGLREVMATLAGTGGGKRMPKEPVT